MVLLTTILLAGCGGQSIRQSQSSPEGSRDQTAESYLQSGQYRAAAEQYQRLAASATGERAQEYRLRAASALISDGDYPAAEALLDQVSSPRADLGLWSDVLRADISLRQGQHERVAALIPESELEGAPAQLVVRARTLRADAFEQSGDNMSALRERVALDMFEPFGGASAGNREDIWGLATGMSTLDRASAPTDSPTTLAGWLELADITGSLSFDRAALEEAIAAWQQRYPGHPANSEIVPTLFAGQSLGVLDAPSRVALLLPLSGAYAEAGRAIQAGFMGALDADLDNATRPDVTVLDTADGDLAEVYSRAVSEGAQLIVGPLQKSAVNTIARAGSLPVPTLVLNEPDFGQKVEGFAKDDEPPESVSPNAPLQQQPANGLPVEDAQLADGTAPLGTLDQSSLIPDTLPAGLFLFALSPEGEASQAAERAWFDGHQSALVMVPENDWGARVAQAFTTTFESLGGRVLETQPYPNEAKGLSQPVKVALRVSDSEYRYRALSKLLGRNIDYQPRRRQDLDFIFMAAFPKHARLLRPLFKFHHASDLPVYATSHTYTGVPNARTDEDINDVAFGDMPWMVQPEATDTELRDSLLDQWRSRSTYWRLLAFGTDAYNLVGRLGALQTQPAAEFNGNTGRLTLDNRNRIQRRLTWARFERGLPTPIDGDGDLDTKTQ